ncbi:hypothetical protein EVAR_82435_1 [Eumeta japonica]|uniref:Uncharacterized protein n=1 Tax=Eumeta variegata TaxID=151549 RepID=A0A4C1YKR5_EUMVA|nr:hypothetical protein EVAR_82435_1 [Eumeta japonica]
MSGDDHLLFCYWEAHLPFEYAIEKKNTGSRGTTGTHETMGRLLLWGSNEGAECSQLNVNVAEDARRRRRAARGPVRRRLPPAQPAAPPPPPAPRLPERDAEPSAQGKESFLGPGKGEAIFEPREARSGLEGETVRVPVSANRPQHFIEKITDGDR